EAAPEDDFAAMTQEEVLTELDPSLGDAEATAVAQEKTVAELAAEPEADIVAEDRARRSGGDHGDDVQLVRAPGVKRRGSQRRLPRHRQAHALRGDQRDHHPDPIQRDELADRHEASSFTTSTAPPPNRNCRAGTSQSFGA